MTHPAFQLDWNLVRTFTAVTSSGSLTAAAGVLGLTYPTVARHVAQLEESLQLTLFDRTSSGMAPTAAGLRLAAAARDMRSQAQAFEAASDSLRTDPGGSVRITLSEFMTPLMAELLLPLQNTISETQANIEVVPSLALMNLLEHDADIALRHVRPTQTDLICRRVGDVELGLWGQRNYLARQREDAKVDENARASDLPALQYIDGATHTLLQRGAKNMGEPIDKRRVNYLSDCTWSQLHAARNGWGVAALPDYLGSRYDDLERISTTIPIPKLELWLVARQDMREKPLHRNTFDALANAINARFGSANDSLGALTCSDETLAQSTPQKTARTAR